MALRPSNIPSTVGVPGGAPNSPQAVAAYLTQLVTGLNTWVSQAANAVNATITGQIPGTPTNNNASAGNVGEYVSSIVLQGSAVSLTTATAVNVTSFNPPLTAGDWDVWGEAWFVGVAATATAARGNINTSISGISNVPADGTSEATASWTGTPGLLVLALAPCRVTIPVNTTGTPYLNSISVFSAGTVSAFGKLCARRRR